jgi:hypothetical protein
MPEPSLDLKANQKSSWYSRYWIYTPLIVCVLIMLPRLISPQFGLLDDGRSLTIAQGIVHGKWDLSWDVIAGRARPVYWAAFAFWYYFAGGHAIWYFLGNLIVFSATTFLLVRLVVMLGGSNLQAWLTGLVFTLSTPVIENVYTLYKGENFQVLLLVSAIGLVVMAVKSAQGVRYWLLMICAALLMLVACFTKENTLVMLPISLVWWAIAWIGRVRHISSAPFVEIVTRWIMLSSLVSSLVFYLGRTLMLSSKILGVGQSSEFSFTPSQILNSIVRWGGWMLRDYLWLLPMMLMVLVVCLLQRRWPRSGLWWLAGVWMVFWLGLYLPWHFALEYYLLPFAAGTAVLTGVMLVEIIDLVKQSGRIWRWMSGAVLTLTTILLFATQANSFTDASIQLSQDAANSRVLEYVVENAPEGSLVMVNIQLANEYIEQMQLMLDNFYHRPDLELVNYQGEDLSLLKTQSHATYFLLADLENQPKMTVRMGLDEPSLQVWNASVRPVLSSWHDVFQVTEDPHVLTVDFPRLLCSVIYRENYCSAGTGLVNYKQFHYQWSVYTP